MRLDRFLSNQTQYTRDEIKKRIKNGDVEVDGIKIKDIAFSVNPHVSRVTLEGHDILYKEHITLIMNKPSGYVCATKDNVHQTVLQLLKSPYDAFDFKIVGRLDKDTEGLLILTTDGKIVHKLTSPHKHIYKTYFVEVDKPIDDIEIFSKVYAIKDGNDQLYQPNKPIIKKLSEKTCLFSIDEGKFHQVKRMFAYFGYEVTYLKRISIGNLFLDESLLLGAYKEVEDDIMLKIESHENLTKI